MQKVQKNIKRLQFRFVTSPGAPETRRESAADYDRQNTFV